MLLFTHFSVQIYKKQTILTKKPAILHEKRTSFEILWTIFTFAKRKKQEEEACAFLFLPVIILPDPT